MKNLVIVKLRGFFMCTHKQKLLNGYIWHNVWNNHYKHLKGF